MFKVKTIGLKEVLNKIERYDKNIANGVDKKMSESATNIATTAAVTAPKGRTGALAASIGATINVRFSKRVFANAPYAPYVEFGTGIHVFETPGFNFTPEIREYAKEFYVSGQGKQYAQPYLFPAYEIEKVKLVNGIKEVLRLK